MYRSMLHENDVHIYVLSQKLLAIMINYYYL